MALSFPRSHIELPKAWGDTRVGFCQKQLRELKDYPSIAFQIGICNGQLDRNIWCLITLKLWIQKNFMAPRLHGLMAVVHKSKKGSGWFLDLSPPVIYVKTKLTVHSKGQQHLHLVGYLPGRGGTGESAKLKRVWIMCLLVRTGLENKESSSSPLFSVNHLKQECWNSLWHSKPGDIQVPYPLAPNEALSKWAKPSAQQEEEKLRVKGCLWRGKGSGQLPPYQKLISTP